jgi:hypothetical protein
LAFKTAAAKGNAAQTSADAEETRRQGQRDVAEHGHDGAGEQHMLETHHPIGNPGADDRGQVDKATVGTHDAGGGGLRKA